MAVDRLFSSLDRVAAHLPFGLHETDQVNAAFESWLQDGDPEQKRVVDLWTYCFVRRYVLLKFTVEQGATASDLEMLVERMYRRIDEKRGTIEDALRYAAWVSVVCKHTYLNYLRSSNRTLVFESTHMPLSVTEPEDIGYDKAVLLDALHAACDRLPPYLREVARMRFIQDLPYVEMARRTQLPLPIIRSYVSKILHRFRSDHLLTRLLKSEEEELHRTTL